MAAAVFYDQRNSQAQALLPTRTGPREAIHPAKAAALASHVAGTREDNTIVSRTMSSA